MLDADDKCLKMHAQPCTLDKSFGTIDACEFAPLLPLVQRRALKVRGTTGTVLKALGAAWHPDSKHLVSIDQQGLVVLWDTATKSVRQYLSRPHATAVAIAPTPADPEHKLTIAVGGLDNAINLCDMTPTRESGEVSLRMPATGESHDGLIVSLAFLDNENLASGGGDGDMRLWNVARGVTTSVLSGHKRDLTMLAMHRPADGATATRIATSSLDGTVRVWDARAGVESHVFECASGLANGMASKSPPEATCVDFFPTGDAVAAGTADGSLHIFDLRSRGTLATLQAKTKPAPSRVTGVGWSLSGRGLYTSHEDGALGVWEPYGTTAGRVFCHMPYKAVDSRAQPIVGLTMAPDKSALAVACYDHAVRVFTPKPAKNK